MDMTEYVNKLERRMSNESGPAYAPMEQKHTHAPKFKERIYGVTCLCTEGKYYYRWFASVSLCDKIAGRIHNRENVKYIVKRSPSGAIAIYKKFIKPKTSGAQKNGK